MLQTLIKANPTLCKNILKAADDDLIKALLEINLNTLNGNINLTEKDKKTLSAYKNCLRKLVKQEDISKNRKFLIQRGANFIPLLLSALFSSAVGSLIQK